MVLLSQFARRREHRQEIRRCCHHGHSTRYEQFFATSNQNPGLLARRQATNSASPELTTMNGNIDMPDREPENEAGVQLEQQRTNTQTPDPTEMIAAEGPLTPRNNAGPFVFDGSAGRADARQLFIPSLAQVADAK